MTPIKQQIQAAIEAVFSEWCKHPSAASSIRSLPLVMAAIKPVLDDARALADEWRITSTHKFLTCDCIYCRIARRILAETEPGPGADSSLLPSMAASAGIASVPPGPVAIKYYLAGPMTGIEEFNFPAFRAAAIRLRSLGYAVVNPAEVVTDTKTPWVECMKKDIAAMMECDGVATLPGHEASKGATLEIHIARALGMPVMDAALLRRDLSEQPRQAATGVPNNDGVTQNDVSDITLCPRCEGCGVYNFRPCAICNGTGRLGPDGEAFKPIPTIAGAADAMKTPGPPEPWAAAIAKLAKRLHAVETKLAENGGAA